MRRALRLGAVLLAALAFAVDGGGPAGARIEPAAQDDCAIAFAMDEGCHMALGINEPATASPLTASTCTYGSRVWIEEVGKDGVTQIKMRFELRAPYDPGIPWLTYGVTEYVYSATWPDDFTSNPYYFGMSPGALTSPTGGTYSLRVWSKGIRPGWWRRDHRLGVTVADDLGCEDDPTDDGGGAGECNPCLPAPTPVNPN